ncbi:hypothetical protein M2152_001834 [Microbacteriaceae bacterium SG_E_30_P1]|uniref:Protein-glutamine gamma-glutamyltransferase-like C-terminal domain-containing protein n=1 Tax=Antiquaquibacter oligotrophicus TaxID=2880260 RepID=A0ABT6KR24_9MICO|nr:DUF4129 domain-containing protein [Antiquaquibacter oligotrophicus]MDH6181652.1 hypothetical protein [Antiquaquibacter oligotrophicus]UDF12664.1 DUF4129 domain-containing protein [Antiquaquibacter oligotrophicus]
MIIAPTTVPVDPDADEAREWLVTELSGPQYQAARPTLIDQVAQAIWDWLMSLQVGTVQGPPAFGIAIVLVLVAAAVIVAILVFGVPRLNRRSAVAGALFGEDDERDSAALRKDAQTAAARGDWNTAIAEMFRATAKGLAERGILTTTPGTTARAFALGASERLPDLAESFQGAAKVFDNVRYLGASGTREEYELVADLEAHARERRAASAVVVA